MRPTMPVDRFTDPAVAAACDVRSLFFARPERLESKLAMLNAVTIVLDLEDGVPTVQKPMRRVRLAELMSSGTLDGRTVLLRVNGIDRPEMVEQDLRMCLHPHVHGLVLPMLRSADDIALFDAFVAAAERSAGIPVGTTAFYPLIERASAVLDAARIASASPRVRALCFGHADFLSSLPAFPGASAVDAAMAHIVLAAGAAGVPAIASPYLDIGNDRGFGNYCRRMREQGFAGVFTLRPRQDETARTVFAVSALEVQRARLVLDEVYPARAFGTVAGKMVGPPMAERAVRLLAHQPATRIPARDPVVGQPRAHGLDLSTAQPGQLIASPHELTVDDSWRTTWTASFPTANRMVTSKPYARAWGLPDRALPPSLLLNLTLCMSVEPFSQNCRLHLGIQDAVQLNHASAGDTFRNYIRLDSIRNTSRGDASVVHSTHVLVNQHGDCVYRLAKVSYFDPVSALPRQVATPDPATRSWFDQSATTSTFQDSLHTGGPTEPPSTTPLTEGALILHSMVRPIGWSENLLLTTLVRNTHPVHFDSEHYPRDEILVSGGFVQAMAFAVGETDLRQVLCETVEHASHINTVTPEDRVGAITRVLSVRNVSDTLERVRVKTLGLKNVDVAVELAGVPIPGKLFDPTPATPRDIEALCRRECPELEGRIALQASRSLLRARP